MVPRSPRSAAAALICHAYTYCTPARWHQNAQPRTQFLRVHTVEFLICTSKRLLNYIIYWKLCRSLGSSQKNLATATWIRRIEIDGVRDKSLGVIITIKMSNKFGLPDKGSKEIHVSLLYRRNNAQWRRYFLRLPFFRHPGGVSSWTNVLFDWEPPTSMPSKTNSNKNVGAKWW